MSGSKRILVTGGAGFVGSHLCERLLREGHEIIAADNMFTGAHRNVAKLLENPRFKLMQHDVTNPLFVEVDQIYNMACPASPVHYQYDPIHTMKTSVLGAINMLGLAKRTGARILQASTSEIYGDPEVHPQVESYRGLVNICGPRACYDEGKRAAETLFYDYNRRNNVDTRIVRIFNTYGPRMHQEDGRVVSNFIVKALLGQPIEVYGNGQQTRSFCYVDDLVDGIIKLMNYEGATAVDPVNIGNPAEMTVLELAQKVIAMTGSRSQIVNKPLPQDDPRQRQPDITRARQLLGWQPHVALEEGLKRTISHFESVLAGSNSAGRAAEKVA